MLLWKYYSDFTKFWRFYLAVSLKSTIFASDKRLIS